jgi:DNA invertase Pin-like site-specific DNA recombinase
MLKIGYVQLREEASQQEAAALREAGCQVIRSEEPGDAAVLNAILDFVGSGDELMVPRLDHISSSGRLILGTLERLEARGASLTVLDPGLSSRGPSGDALRAVLAAVAQLEPASTSRRRRPGSATNEIFALQRAGVGPVEIARRLGVSRMTVWRKLKRSESLDA